MTAAERPEAPPFLQTAAVGALMLALAATPLAAARFAGNPFFLLTLKWTVAAILLLPAAAVLILGSPTLGRARYGDGVVAAWFGLGVLATAGAEAFGPAVTRLTEMTTVAAAYFIASRASDRGLVRSAFVGVVLPVAAIVASYSIAQHMGANPLRLVSEGEDQLCATFVNRNLLAGFLAFSLVIGLEAIASARRPVARAAATGAVTVIVAALVLSSTRGAWVGAAGAFVLWVLRPERLRLAALAPILLGVILGAGVSHHEGSSGRLKVDGHKKSVGERKMLWRIGRDLLVDRPLLGWGPGNFDSASETKKAPYFRQKENRAIFQLPRFAHNDAVELSTEMGIPGAVLWLCLIGALARRVRREWHSEGGAIALGCVALAVHGLFHWSLHDPVASLLFFAGLGATAPMAPSTEPIRPWVARGVKLAVALGTAITLLTMTRTLAARTLFERGVAEQQAGEIHQALWTQRSACLLDPAFAEALSQRAFLLAEMGFPADALNLLEAAREAAPYDEAVRFNQGILHERRGSLASARRAFEDVKDGNPNLADVYFSLARVEEADGKPDQAARWRSEAALILGERLRER